MTGHLPEILVINLDKSADRLDSQRAQFARLGLAFTRIPAVAGDTIDDGYYRRMRASGSRLMTRNEVGCVLSHAACWRHCVEKGEPVVVLEDDIVLDPAIASVLAAFEPLAREGGLLVNLEYFDGRKRLGATIAQTQDGAFSLCELAGSGAGTGGYLVTPAAAERLLALTEKRLHIADMHINYVPGVTYAQVSPAPAAQMWLCASEHRIHGRIPSTIHGGAHRRPKSLASFLSNPVTRLRRLSINLVKWRRQIRASLRGHDGRLEPSPRLVPAFRELEGAGE